MEEVIKLNGNLEEGKTYSLYVNVKGDEGYGSSDPYECWDISFSGTAIPKGFIMNMENIFNV